MPNPAIRVLVHELHAGVCGPRAGNLAEGWCPFGRPTGAEAGRPEEAAQNFRKAGESAFYPPALYGLALIYQEAGNCERAAPLWKTLIQSPGLSEGEKAKAAHHLSRCEETGGKAKG